MKIRIGRLTDISDYKDVFVFSICLFTDYRSYVYGDIVVESQRDTEDILDAIFWYTEFYPGTSLESYFNLTPTAIANIKAMYEDGWGSCKGYTISHYELHYYDDFGRQHEVIVENEK